MKPKMENYRKDELKLQRKTISRSGVHRSAHIKIQEINLHFFFSIIIKHIRTIDDASVISIFSNLFSVISRST